MLEDQQNESGILNLVFVLVSVYIVRTPVMQYTIRLVTRYVARRNSSAASWWVEKETYINLDLLLFGFHRH